jgi:rod shape-determining protein MreC
MSNFKKSLYYIYVTGFIIFLSSNIFDINYYFEITKKIDGIKQYCNQLVFVTKEKIDLVTSNYSTLEEVARLREENEKLKITLLSALSYVKESKKIDNIKIQSPKIQKSKIISFVDIAQYNRIWIAYDYLKEDSVYGLIYNNNVMGIAVAKNNKLLGYLNSDIKCSYSVLIGKNRVNAIINMDVKQKSYSTIIGSYIELSQNVNIGDEVITSGLDGIFFKGIKVGKVIKIVINNGFKKAIIRPYFKYNNIGYFTYVIDI